MTEVRTTVSIDAQPEDVFAYMDDPHNQVEITPSLTEVRDIEELPNGGKRLGYTYQMAGVGLDGTMETTEYEPAERVVFEMTGAIDGTIEWTFETENGTTRVTYTAEYDLPVPVLDRVVEPFAVRYNERELETTLANLKTRLEA